MISVPLSSDDVPTHKLQHLSHGSFSVTAVTVPHPKPKSPHIPFCIDRTGCGLQQLQALKSAATAPESQQGSQIRILTLTFTLPWQHKRNVPFRNGELRFSPEQPNITQQVHIISEQKANLCLRPVLKIFKLEFLGLNLQSAMSSTCHQVLCQNTLLLEANWLVFNRQLHLALHKITRNNYLHKLGSLHFSPCVSAEKLETALDSKEGKYSPSQSSPGAALLMQDLFLICLTANTSSGISRKSQTKAVANGQCCPNCLWEGGELAQTKARDIALYKQEWNGILASLVGGTDWRECKHFTQTTKQLTPHYWPGLDFSQHSRCEKNLNKPKSTSNQYTVFFSPLFILIHTKY